ncbi:MAG: ThuA domain-containing protein [Isosphaeraceae bacterium]
MKSVCLEDPGQGLSKETLDGCDVLIWWGHVRQREIQPNLARDIVRRLQEGRLSLIALHSAHWSTPFVEAMNERAREDARRLAADRGLREVAIREHAPQLGVVPRRTDPTTPRVEISSKPDGNATVLDLWLPSCVFPAYRGDGMPSHVRVLRPDHPIVRGIPQQFDIPQTEMYDEPFFVPPPDEVVFEERWDRGERFRSGAIWKLGKGRVFYFRPGHETYPVFKQPEVLQILENSVRWLASFKD